MDGHRSSGEGDREMLERRKWRKILYERQQFSDEYSGGSEFLKELRTNMTVVEYTYVEAMCGASRVMLHANAIIFYYLVFDSINGDDARNFTMIFACALLLYVAYVCAVIRPRALRDHFDTFATLLCFGYALTPVIRTLTDTISTDTIYAMSFIMFLLSFVFHDYAMSAPMVSTILSVNLSLSASVCLVSRLHSNESAFGLLALSVLLFSYWPQMRNVLCRKWPKSSLLLVLVSGAPLCTELHRYSASLSALYSFVITFVVLLCPLILMKMQPWKSCLYDGTTVSWPILHCCDCLFRTFEEYIPTCLDSIQKPPFPT